MQSFSQKIVKIGINPCVVPPTDVLNAIFKQSGKDRGPIPVRGMLNGARYTQTLVKYQGAWRLYINGTMLEASGLKNGDIAQVKIEYDPTDRTIPIHPELSKQFTKNATVKKAYAALAPHRQKEINRYLLGLKTKESLDRNVEIVLTQLSGKKTKGLHALLRVKP